MTRKRLYRQLISPTRGIAYPTQVPSLMVEARVYRNSFHGLQWESTVIKAVIKHNHITNAPWSSTLPCISPFPIPKSSRTKPDSKWLLFMPGSESPKSNICLQLVPNHHSHSKQSFKRYGRPDTDTICFPKLWHFSYCSFFHPLPFNGKVQQKHLRRFWWVCMDHISHLACIMKVTAMSWHNQYNNH